MEAKATMTKEERIEDAISRAEGISAIEGIIISAEEREMIRRGLAGEITKEEYVKWVLENAQVTYDKQNN